MAVLHIRPVRKMTCADWLPRRATRFPYRMAPFVGKISEMIWIQTNEIHVLYIFKQVSLNYQLAKQNSFKSHKTSKTKSIKYIVYKPPLFGSVWEYIRLQFVWQTSLPRLSVWMKTSGISLSPICLTLVLWVMYVQCLWYSTFITSEVSSCGLSSSHDRLISLSRFTYYDYTDGPCAGEILWQSSCCGLIHFWFYASLTSFQTSWIPSSGIIQLL